MDQKRLRLRDMLTDIPGVAAIYFQPPSTGIKYPCIMYALDQILNTHTDDGVYIQRKRYTVTVIDSNPDSTIVDDVSKLSTIRHDRVYVADNLYHNVFTITL